MTEPTTREQTLYRRFLRLKRARDAAWAVYAPFYYGDQNEPREQRIESGRRWARLNGLCHITLNWLEHC